MQYGLLENLQRSTHETDAVSYRRMTALQVVHQHVRVQRLQPCNFLVPSHGHGGDGRERLTDRSGGIQQVLTNASFHTSLRMVLKLARIPPKNRCRLAQPLRQTQTLHM